MATIWEADGESAGSTPWEFDSLQEDTGSAFTLEAAAAKNGSYGYKDLVSNSGYCYGVKALADLTEFYAQISFKLTDIAPLFDYDRLYLFWMLDAAVDLMWLNLAWHSSGWGVEYRIYGQSLDYSVIDKAGDYIITDTNWHTIEIYYKYGDADNGIGKGWIDGDLAGSMTNVDCKIGTLVDTLYVGAYNASGNFGSGDYFYMDDILFSTTEIGPYNEAAGGGAKKAAARSLLLHSF